jgi:flagellar biogenesis protein FliO
VSVVATLLAVSSAELTIRMVVGLAVVGLLLWILHRVTRRVLDGRGAGRPTITIRHQQRLDRNASVTLLTAGERNLLIGTSGQAIVLLAEGDDLAARAPTPAPAEAGAGHDVSIDVRSAGWTNPIRALQNMTVRRG